MSENGDFENPKAINHDFSTKSIPEQYGFLNTMVPWGRKNRTIWGLPVLQLCYQNEGTGKVRQLTVTAQESAKLIAQHQKDFNCEGKKDDQ